MLKDILGGGVRIVEQYFILKDKNSPNKVSRGGGGKCPPPPP